jgi:hypothetical protein
MVKLKTLGIDAALRTTGVCYLNNSRSQLFKSRLPRRFNRDDLLVHAIKTLEPIFSDGVDVAVIEFPPPRYSKKRKDVSALLAFCSGVWFSACHMLGAERVVSVEVRDWRRIMLGKGTTKADAELLLRAYKHKTKLFQDITGHDEAEALCLALYGRTLSVDI